MSCYFLDVYAMQVLIHIADAPCHGLQFHDSATNDDYPGGDPAGLQLDGLMKQFADKDITYHFGYIKESCTSVMIKAFNSSLQAQSNKVHHSIKLFDASDPSSLLDGVFNSVTCSITATFDILMTGGVRCPRKYTLDEEIPRWDDLQSQWVMITPPPTVGSAAKREAPNQPMKIKIAPQPFAEGAQKIAYHAFDEDKNEHIVLKQSRWTDARSNSIKRCIETAQVHAIAANYCAEFSRDKPLSVNASEIQFVPVGVMQVTDQDKQHYYTYERYLESGYTKFNSSFYYTHEHEDHTTNTTCQAFSHYTWVKSGKQLVICDLQGIKVGSRVILTDPVIHYTNVLCHGSTNLGDKGICRFFQLHKCNEICQAMKLSK